ncbi:malate dehydrogenase, partial [Baffinella frigidus]
MASLPPLQIAVTGAAGQIAYSLLPHICLGRTFGPNRNVQLRLLDIDRAQKALGGVKMELEDCGFDLLKGVTFTADPSVAFKDVDVVIMLGAFPRGPGMQRADLLAKNCNIFKQQGRLLNEIASKDVKVVVVGNPANTNAWVCAESAPNIPKTNFTALTRLDANRAQDFIAMRVGVPASKVEQALIWGNHSSTQYPDVTSAKVVGPSGKVPVKTAVNNDAYLQSEFIKTVQNRGAAVIDARKLSSAMSAAKAISDHMHDFICGSDGRVVSMAVPSDGSYDIQKGLMFSFPVICKPGGKYEIVQGLPVDSFSRTMLDET